LQNTATRNLSIIGTKDHWWDAAKEYLTETDLIIEVADHRLKSEVTRSDQSVFFQISRPKLMIDLKPKMLRLFVKM
jgi:hypothetical protein